MGNLRAAETLIVNPPSRRQSLRILDWSKGGLEIEDGSLYPALGRMLIRAAWGTTDINRRARFDRLIPQGRE